jgi:hypothetical protein
MGRVSIDGCILEDLEYSSMLVASVKSSKSKFSLSTTLMPQPIDKKINRCDTSHFVTSNTASNSHSSGTRVQLLLNSLPRTQGNRNTQ